MKSFMLVLLIVALLFAIVILTGSINIRLEAIAPRSSSAPITTAGVRSTQTPGSTAETAAPSAAPSSYGRLNPAPIGVSQTYSDSYLLTDYTATVTFNSVERGASAWEKIQAANMFNSEPADGMEYVLANVSVALLSSKDDAVVSFSGVSFDVYSSDYVQYEDLLAVVAPDPQLSGNIYPGGTNTGYVVFQVSKADAQPKAAIGLDYRGAGGVWFSLS